MHAKAAVFQNYYTNVYLNKELVKRCEEKKLYSCHFGHFAFTALTDSFQSPLETTTRPFALASQISSEMSRMSSFFKFFFRQEIVNYFEFHKASSASPAISKLRNTNIKYILRIYISSIPNKPQKSTSFEAKAQSHP